MTEYEGRTPGPWRLLDDDGSDAHGRLIWGGATSARCSQGYPVAIVLPEGHEAEFEANARLIRDATTLLAERDEARAQLYTARVATDVLCVGFNATCAQRDALEETLRKLEKATAYLMDNYLQDETEDRNLAHSDDHWAALNLVATALGDARAALEKARGT